MAYYKFYERILHVKDEIWVYDRKGNRVEEYL